ncbi:MAG: hypothetical protein OFPII_16330 [Osedax symbiont Rs1]|nr:MAG: hypothetical protein OFPII_16330 [Osedax symbiont Rs1]
MAIIISYLSSSNLKIATELQREARFFQWCCKTNILTLCIPSEVINSGSRHRLTMSA